MRVICIDDSKRGFNHLECLVKEGEVYEVSTRSDIKGYHIEGVTPHGECPNVIVSYKKDRFIPLSEIDERELAHAEPMEFTYTITVPRKQGDHLFDLQHYLGGFNCESQ
ncbi:MAG: hypothetical protein V4687_16215 [Bacteroidota bacterium]